jgi:hypothetical protein
MKVASKVASPAACPSVTPVSSVSRRTATGIVAGMESYDPSDDRRAGRDSDWTDAESEGLPATEDQPPGIGPETAEEGMPLPRDHPLGSEERGVTQLEEAKPETVRERAARERPDLPQEAPGDPRGRLAAGATDTDDDPGEGDWAGDSAGLSAEEAAVHIEEG